MKKFAMLFAVVFAVVAAFTYVKAVDVDKGPDVITIDKYVTPAGKKAKPPVEFKHKLHQEKRAKDCVTCHHATKEGEKPKACSECHATDPAKKTDDTPDYKKAMHDMCKDCHKKEKAAGKKAPTKCKECHPGAEEK